MPSSNPSERVLIGRIAANMRWANTANRNAATAPGRAAFLARFEREVDPNGLLVPAERARRAESARKAYFANLARKSARSRRLSEDERRDANRKAAASLKSQRKASA